MTTVDRGPQGSFTFWKSEPKPPRRDVRSWSLLIPAMFSATGFFAFAVLAFSFTEMALLPRWFRTGLVILGAFCLAVGGEVGTLTTTTEIFRKSRQGEAIWWDWVGLGLSLCATLAEFLLAFATLLGTLARLEGKAPWAEPMQLYGPIALGLLSALDSYVNFMEYGLYLSTWDKRMTEYLKEYDKERKRWERRKERARKDKKMPSVSSTSGLTSGSAPSKHPSSKQCWCGEMSPPDVDPDQWYETHLQAVHGPEMCRYDSPVSARSALQEKYSSTLVKSDFEFPTIQTFAKTMSLVAWA